MLNLRRLRTTALQDCHTIARCPHLYARGVPVCRDDNDRASNGPPLYFSYGLSGSQARLATGVQSLSEGADLMSSLA